MKKLGAELKPAILVLDDDVLSLELYSRELSSNYQVITSESVENARANLTRHTITVCIIEPTTNADEGWSFIREIRALSNPPVVIICSVADDRSIGFEHGVNAYVVKPVLPIALHQLIDQIISQKRFSSVQGME